jgi:hypothetical protein
MLRKPLRLDLADAAGLAERIYRPGLSAVCAPQRPRVRTMASDDRIELVIDPHRRNRSSRSVEADPRGATLYADRLLAVPASAQQAELSDSDGSRRASN